jgi:hypothetical protein
MDDHMKQKKRPLPPNIQRVLAETRGMLGGYLRWKSLLLIVCWILLLFWMGGALDYLPVKVGAAETPRWVRIGLLLSMALGCAWILLVWLLPRLMTRISDSSLALLIEKQYPELKNELVTAIELNERPAEVSNPNAHEEMLLRVMASAEDAARKIDIDRLFNWRPINRLRIFAMVGAAVTMLFGIIFWGWFSIWGSRLFLLSEVKWPRSAALRVDWMQIPLPAFTGQLTSGNKKIEFQNNAAFIPAGASILLQVSADANASRIPEVCTMYYRSEDGARGRANLRRIGTPREGWQQFNLDGPPLDGITSALTLDVVGLDARLRDLRLQVVDPIVIVDMQVDCIYPEYLLDSLSTRATRERMAYRTGLRIPEGTDCSLIGACNSGLSSVEYVVRKPDLTFDSEVLNIFSADLDQRQFKIHLGQIRESQMIEIRLFDEFGLPSDQILRYNIVVVNDVIPQVESRLEGVGLAITPRAFLPVRGRVTDDYGIQSVNVELSVDEFVFEPLTLSMSDEQLNGEIDFLQLSRAGLVQLQPGMTVGVSVTATDYFNLDELPRTGRGQPVQLAVVTDDQLLVILDRQELELRQRLEQILSELNQLNEALGGLREELIGLESSAQLDSLRDTTPGMVYQKSHGNTQKLVRTPVQGIPQWLVGNILSFPYTQTEQEDSQKRNQRQSTVRMSVLRAQQTQLQTDKSRQELAGIANRIEHLRLQLVNNRIDSQDRQQRLLEQVQIPLTGLLGGEYVQLDRKVSELVSATMIGQGTTQANEAMVSLEKILLELEKIRANLLDIESFNELIDLVRGLLDAQEKILSETEETQRIRILDFFN